MLSNPAELPISPYIPLGPIASYPCRGTKPSNDPACRARRRTQRHALLPHVPALEAVCRATSAGRVACSRPPSPAIVVAAPLSPAGRPAPQRQPSRSRRSCPSHRLPRIEPRQAARSRHPHGELGWRRPRQCHRRLAPADRHSTHPRALVCHPARRRRV